MPFQPRAVFPFPLRAPSWFVGHMAQSLRRLPALLEDIDLVIEARDARLPLTSINPVFDRALESAWGYVAGPSGTAGWDGKGKGKEKVVVYTKRDLAEAKYEQPLRKAFKRLAGHEVFFADTRSDVDVRKVLKHAVRIARANAETMPEMRILVVGMPNVGKSSLLNALRRVGVNKGKAFRTGALAGVTRKLTGTVKIYEDPTIYVYDTPGMMLPWLGNGAEGSEKGLKYALTAGIKDDLIEPEAYVDFLLWYMNYHLVAEHHLPLDHPDRHKSYLDLFPDPHHIDLTDDVYFFLDCLAGRLGTLKKGGERDTDTARSWFIRAFREGKIGRWTLDDLTSPPSASNEDSSTSDEGQQVVNDGEQRTLPPSHDQRPLIPDVSQSPLIPDTEPEPAETPEQEEPDSSPASSPETFNLEQAVHAAVETSLARTAQQHFDRAGGKEMSGAQRKKADKKERAAEQRAKRASKVMAAGGGGSRSGAVSRSRPRPASKTHTQHNKRRGR